jgi:hypothetical protein
MQDFRKMAQRTGNAEEWNKFIERFTEWVPRLCQLRATLPTLRLAETVSTAKRKRVEAPAASPSRPKAVAAAAATLSSPVRSSGLAILESSLAKDTPRTPSWIAQRRSKGSSNPSDSIRPSAGSIPRALNVAVSGPAAVPTLSRPITASSLSVGKTPVRIQSAPSLGSGPQTTTPGAVTGPEGEKLVCQPRPTHTHTPTLHKPHATAIPTTRDRSALISVLHLGQGREAEVVEGEQEAQSRGSKERWGYWFLEQTL